MVTGVARLFARSSPRGCSRSQFSRFCARSALPARCRLARPTASGCPRPRLAAVDRVVERGVEAAGFPGAAVIIGRRNATVLSRGYGSLDWAPSSAARVARSHAVRSRLAHEGRCDDFGGDGAATTSIVSRSTRRSSRYLPAFAHGAKSRVTIRELLEHRSGLPSGRNLSRLAPESDTRARARARDGARARARNRRAVLRRRHGRPRLRRRGDHARGRSITSCVAASSRRSE